MNWSVIIGIFGTLAGFALSYLAFARNSKKDSADAGKESGTVLTEIGYIKANTDDITGKWCPRPWMGDDTNTYYGTSGNEQWKKFKERLSGEELDMNIEEARKQLTSCADTGDTPSAWARDAAEFCKRKGIFNGDGAGNYGWQQPITREAVAQILYNAFESAGMLDAIPDKK